MKRCRRHCRGFLQCAEERSSVQKWGVLFGLSFFPQKEREIHRDIPLVLARKTSLYTRYKQRKEKLTISPYVKWFLFVIASRAKQSRISGTSLDCFVPRNDRKSMWEMREWSGDSCISRKVSYTISKKGFLYPSFPRRRESRFHQLSGSIVQTLFVECLCLAGGIWIPDFSGMTIWKVGV